MKNEYHFHINGNPEKIREVLNLLDGTIQTLTSKDGDIQITWKPSANANPFEKITKILQAGNLDDGILLLDLFLSDNPTDEDVLFNLGMAVSDSGELTRAIDLLSQLVKQAPAHTNGRIALGVALVRSQKTEAGLKELEIAVSQEPDNLWARRNLGGGLMQAERFSEAIEHLRRATELDSTDQAAWVGYGQALQFNGDITQADKAFITAIELDEFSELAERARVARTQLAEKTFHGASDMPRMDAVMYCVSALEKFEKLSLEQVRQIGFEIALLATRGLDTNNPAAKYTLKNMGGNFSGLQLVCYEFVAFKQFAPEQNIGFDLSAEYEAALKLFGKNNK